MVGGSLVSFSSSAESGPVSRQFSWPLFCGHEVAAAAPGIIPMFEEERKGKEVVLVFFLFFFLTEEQKIPQKSPTDVILYFIGQY